MSNPALKRTPLNDVHRASGAKMVDFGGWDMPVQYSGLVDEHNTVRNAVGLFDVSHMGEIEIRGPQAALLTDAVTTNAVSKLQVGQAQYSGLLYDHGGFVDDILVHKVDGDHYFICVNASNQDKDFEHICSLNHFDADVEFASPRYAQIAVQGPRALDTLGKLTSVDIASIHYYWFKDGEVCGIPARIARTGYTGEDGFEIYLAPHEAPGIWQKLLEAGSDFGIKPCGLGCRNTLRLESKMALYGHEIHASISPFEADLAWIVKLDKGDFNGATQSFDPNGKPTSDKLQQAWGALTQQYGKAKSIGGADKGQMVQGYTVVLVPMQFDKGKVGAEAACGVNGQLVMLRFGLMPNEAGSKS